VIALVRESLLLLPFLFATYLVLEAIEAQAGGALGKFLGRARSVGPLAGALAGAVPQCGISAAAASFYAGGVISVGALIAVFLSTSDELLPVLLSERVPVSLLAKIVALKIISAVVTGFAINGLLSFFRRVRRPATVGDLCARSRCGCHARKGILVPALIHTGEIFLFILAVSGTIELALHFWGEEGLLRLHLTTPFVGELAAGALGMVPNCAVSVAAAKLYLAGALSPGALMASSFTGSGVGLLVLFRMNRRPVENLSILAAVYVIGVLLGWLTGRFL
jgi:hypothetical protein